MKNLRQTAPTGSEYNSSPARWTVIFAAIGVVISSGCYSRSNKVSAVDIDVPTVCSKIFAEHDADGDSLLGADELASLPALNNCFRKDDKDGDGKLSSEELQSCFHKVFNSRSGMIAATCRVTNNGKPLTGATVHFIPADFLELDKSVMPVASGITSSQGVAEMEIHPDSLPVDSPKIRGLVRPGFYLVDITHERTKIPPQYNSKSTLGVEVSAETTIGGPIHIPLKF